MDDNRPAYLWLLAAALAALAMVLDFSDRAGTVVGTPLYAVPFGWVAISALVAGLVLTGLHALGGSWWLLAVGLVVFGAGIGAAQYVSAVYVSGDISSVSEGFFLAVAALATLILSAVHTVRAPDYRPAGVAIP